MKASDELLVIADRLSAIAERAKEGGIDEPLTRLVAAAVQLGKASSGSWIGYHANVYYGRLVTPPAGAHFSSEWGLREPFSNDTTGEWREYQAEEIEAEIYRLAGNPNLDAARALAEQASHIFNEQQSEALSVLAAALAERADSFIEARKTEIEKLKPLTESDAVQKLRPKQSMTRDALAVSQGVWVPPHDSIAALVFSLRQPMEACRHLAQECRKAGSHLARVKRKTARSLEVGTNVFIGHGASHAWRDLKDFVKDRLKLPYDEFNRLPVAGVTNVDRLKQMLDSAAIAFLVMTGEDEQADGTRRARMNVIHEAGLFQGRLGFGRAIVLLEEGCEPFSNIEGLGQIRFPKGNIAAKFEDIRLVLEREGILAA
jgi:predicted nucleotide-binding protein